MSVYRDPVDSSAIASLGYESESQVLELEFRGGGVYRYFDVEQEVYEGLLVAASMGRFFSNYIRNVYPCVQVEPAGRGGAAGPGGEPRCFSASGPMR